jgi:hypothetical protein
MPYSNEFEIEGLIGSASGTPGELKEADPVVQPTIQWQPQARRSDQPEHLSRSRRGGLGTAASQLA